MTQSHLMPTQTLSSTRRAIDAQDKLSRRDAILSAAEQLLDRNPHQLPSVQEVAQVAGLAKGTLYLYFETKEAIYLALHQRHTQQFFVALVNQLQSPKAFTLNSLMKLIDQHMVRNKSFFPLCNSCMSVAVHAVDPATVQQFHQALGVWLMRAGQGMESRLPNLKRGDGVRMLHFGYAQMIGLYQLLGNTAGNSQVIARLRQQQQHLGLGSFAAEVHSAITVLWQQSVEHGLPNPKK